MGLLEVTDRALEALRVALSMGSARAVRLRWARSIGGQGSVVVELAEQETSGDQVVEAAGLTIFVDPAVFDSYPDAILDVEPEHQTIVVRAADR